MTLSRLDELDLVESLDETPMPGLRKIDAPRLLAGMFVAALDRPWSDTPLQPGGLLVRGDEDLQAIRSHCRFVMVDPERSPKELTDAIEAAALLSYDRRLAGPDDGWSAAAGRPGTAVARGSGAIRPGAAAASAVRPAQRAGERRADAPKLRDDIRPSSAARQRVQRLALDRAQVPAARDGALSRVRSWIGLSAGGPVLDTQPGSGRDRDALDALRDRWGEPVGAVAWDEGEPLRESLARSRPIHARLVAAADQTMRQVRQGVTVTLEPLTEAAAAFAAAMACAPDAMRWLGTMYAYATPDPNPGIGVAWRLAELGRSIGMPQSSLRELALVGLLADIGKALLPRDRLEHPGVLPPQDYALLQTHVAISVEVLSRSGALPEAVLRGIAEHHERLDGSGYPSGLRGDAIGLYGQMAGIADAFCALTSARPYANPLAIEDALAALADWSGRLFWPDLVERFVLATGLYPIGTLVELAGGEVAAVVDRGQGNRLQPRLVVMTGADKGPVVARPGHGGDRAGGQARSGASVRIARGLPAGAFGLRMKDFYAARG